MNGAVGCKKIMKMFTSTLSSWVSVLSCFSWPISHATIQFHLLSLASESLPFPIASLISLGRHVALPQRSTFAVPLSELSGWRPFPPHGWPQGLCGLVLVHPSSRCPSSCPLHACHTSRNAKLLSDPQTPPCAWLTARTMGFSFWCYFFQKTTPDWLLVQIRNSSCTINSHISLQLLFPHTSELYCHCQVSWAYILPYSIPYAYYEARDREVPSSLINQRLSN